MARRGLKRSLYQRAAVDTDFRPLGTLERDQSSQIDFLLPSQAAAGNMAASGGL